MARDYRANPVRFVAEVVAWALSIGCALTMAITVPAPPLLTIYPLWMFGCLIWMWAAFTRGSTGLLANYSILFIIDCVGLVRLILA